MSKPYRIEGRPQTIYRVVKSSENPYVMVDRRPIDNPALSYKAKGILTYLMSRPDGWEVSVSDLVNHATDGEDKIRSGLNELRKAGHMKYHKTRDKGRITGTLIEVYEIPYSDFPYMALPDVENPTQVIKNLSNNDCGGTATTSDSLKKLFSENIGKLTPILDNKIYEAVNIWGEKWVESAIQEAVLNNVHKWHYVLSILKRWHKEGKVKPDWGMKYRR